MRPLSLFIKVDGVTTPKRLYNVGVGSMDMLDQARVFLARFSAIYWFGYAESAFQGTFHSHTGFTSATPNQPNTLIIAYAA
jgi:hypothetical protein